MKKILIILIIVLGNLVFSAPGMDLEFQTDGNPHFDKFLDKNYGFSDIRDEFKIIKENDDYYIIYRGYVSDDPDSPDFEKEKIEKEKLKIVNGVYLQDSRFAYGYDTSMEQLVILSNEDYKIIFPAENLDFNEVNEVQ